MATGKSIPSGTRFDRLVVIEDRGAIAVACLCDCGKEVLLRRGALRAGNTKSCGCYRREIAATRLYAHGHNRVGAQSATHRCWIGMVARCTNPKNQNWKDYGGRGITVCDHWRTFSSFLADMGEKPAGLWIERLDNSRGYQPGNCHWATPSENQRNRRSNRMLELHGETWPTITWCERLGLDYACVRNRLHRGWTTERALTTPTLGYR